MTPRKFSWLFAMALLTLLAAATAPAFPQEGQQEEQQEQGAAAGEQAAPPVHADAEAAVDAILREHEENRLEPGQFSYDPGDRRDPFRSLFERVREEAGPRPPGIEGMAVDEIDLTGIVSDPEGGDVAYVTGSDSKGYFLKVGHRIYKATLIAINLEDGTVTFRQEVDDPRQIKPYRDVVRKLVPLEGEQR
jgi:hypothetical protein